ncbi:hypothetical protein AU106_gp034 [Sinorhizobium phage phiM9]|uniref:Uncharacterized protein n=1 Tax=Sinorhizobium phage phiM9 TaxID=1636182 RepID=A0A0F6R5R4_9CAUD|nr:hypothetical protein AU106_gp034 [Sinorhizobium phage phiM9]AKE44665.1 hypothetical protein Sm_phiM9_035 [Sinorhizobium phage phiM9]
MSVTASVAKIWAAKKLFTYLSKNFEDLPIYKAGIIDHRGRQIVKMKDMSAQQKRMFGPFERMLLLVKRTLKKHGVTSLALAVTFLEEKKYDEFWSYVDEKAGTKISESRLLHEAEELEKTEEEGEPTTVSSNVAGVEKPLGMTKRKDHNVVS